VHGKLKAWLAPANPDSPKPLTDRTERAAVQVELAIVFAVTLGLSGLRSLLSLVDSLLRTTPLAKQTVALNTPQAKFGLLDLALQLTSALQLFAWGALGAYLIWKAGIALRRIGLDRTRPLADAGMGAVLAAVIGIPGLGFYLASRAIGINLTVLPSTLDDTWWRIPVLLLGAVGNAWAEEVLVVGYLLTRLRQLGLRSNSALLASATLRGSYHLYQGFGGFIGNLLMGLVFGRTWQRTNRLWALVIGHSIIDIVAFVGYAALRTHLTWLP
jgi:membrane protease YdiL (CAAX protease family)